MKLILILGPSELKRRRDGDRDRDRDGEIESRAEESRAEESRGVERREKSCVDSQDMIC